jgi:CRISPR/Cas system CSM-associated protein Csm2 small subunit
MEEKDLIDLHWEIWVDQSKIRSVPFSHFIIALKEQLREIEQYQASGQNEKKLNEVADLIPLALNFLRWHGLTKSQIRQLLRERYLTRYAGQTEEIINKYEKMRREK